VNLNFYLKLVQKADRGLNPELSLATCRADNSPLSAVNLSTNLSSINKEKKKKQKEKKVNNIHTNLKFKTSPC
jgi:hypothetical protein